MYILSQPDLKLSDTQPQRVQPPPARPPLARSGRAGWLQPGSFRSGSLPGSPAKPVKSLGALVRRYPARPLGWGELLALACLGSLGVLAPLGYGLWQTQVIQASHGLVAAQVASRIWYILALLALVCFGWLVIVRLAAQRAFVAVHENGLALRKSWGALSRWRWSAISGLASEHSEHYFLGLRLGTRYRAVLVPTTGKPVRLPDGLANYPELISQLKAILYPRLLPDLEANLQAGQSLYFGPLAISCQGLSHRAQRWTWAEVQHFDIQNGLLEINTRPERKLRFPTSQIPNLELLLQLVSQCAPTRAPA
jgi:hypothetical protein